LINFESALVVLPHPEQGTEYLDKKERESYYATKEQLQLYTYPIKAVIAFLRSIGEI